MLQSPNWLKTKPTLSFVFWHKPTVTSTHTDTNTHHASPVYILYKSRHHQPYHNHASVWGDASRVHVFLLSPLSHSLLNYFLYSQHNCTTHIRYFSLDDIFFQDIVAKGCKTILSAALCGFIRPRLALCLFPLERKRDLSLLCGCFYFWPEDMK